MNEHREGGQVLWSARTKGCPKPFNWSIINLTLYLFITYKCKAGLKGRVVPVEDCIATTAVLNGKGCGGMGGGGIRDGVWGAVKEGEGSKVTVDG
jgi:hypothetical protein